jgi:Do/DeqQ family serine protease
MLRWVMAICLAVGLAAAGRPALAEVPVSQAQLRLSFAPVVKATAPAVVNVFSKSLVKQADPTGVFDDPFFREFFGNRGGGGIPREQVQNSLGSGVIVDPTGLIVTNNHVIKGGTDIRVVLADKREFEAKVLLADERSDLAVLKIDVGDEQLAALKFANSDDLEVGDLVLAIGNPFGVGQTVTSGIVSALARTQVGVTDYQFFIQTDAAINPGNSGGALVNMKGELVGINTAIYSRSGGSIGIGFSIPANMVATVVQSAESGGKTILRPWAGIELQDVTPDIANSLGFARPEGALVTALDSNSPFAAAGLKRGDVILAMDGHAIENAREFGYRLATSRIGQQSIVEYQRAGAQLEASVKMIAAPETVKRQQTRLTQHSPMQGLVVANLSPAVSEELGVGLGLTGVVAVDVGQGPAQQFFQKGDIVLAVNGAPITKVDELVQAVDANPGVWTIQIKRGSRSLIFKLRG